LGVDVPNGGQVNINADHIFQGDNNQNGAMVSYGEEGLTYAVNSFTVSDTSFDNLGTRNSTGIQELKNGTPTCLVPVQLSNATFQNVTTQVNPPSCADPPTPVPEPPTLWLLLSAIVGWAATGQCSSRIVAPQGS
jgi:hypothetical protein